MDCINQLSLCLSQGGMDAGLAEFISIFLGVVLVATFPLLVTILLIWVERKFAARIQDRIGPNRVGPFGLLQPFADVVKLLGKENITPTGADKPIYNFAPPMMVASVLLIWAVVPFSPYHIGSDLEIGALYTITVASIGTLAVMMAGWASNNKYALLGAFRVVAQLISYEVPLAMAVLVPVMLAGSMAMQGIVEAQYGMWFMFSAPVAAFLFFISSQAETGRAPFDLLEAESELVAGFNIEYSGMKFAMFFAGEFMHVFTNGVLMAVFFSGGWLGPFAEQAPLLGVFYLLGKASVWYLVSLWVRNSV
ncbi:MAG: NADH-quinone oxidoreductase subunit H, partial [Anaerolineae bacterium]|nr:NADH-quinone oxidoreductase subunit H [Anaerolineae bacterium]